MRGSYGQDMVGFDDARFEPAGGGTKLTFRFYAEYKIKTRPLHPNAGGSDNGGGMMGNLENLKRIVENQ